MFSHQHKFEINYIYKNDPRAQIVEADSERFPRERAARYLMELHQADAENSLVMPAPDASEEELLRQAQIVGITDIRVTKLVREHEPGTTPGHYQQP